MIQFVQNAKTMWQKAKIKQNQKTEKKIFIHFENLLF